MARGSALRTNADQFTGARTRISVTVRPAHTRVPGAPVVVVSSDNAAGRLADRTNVGAEHRR
jgi:hypothetical protein